jgi:hypothetical protein
MKLTQTMQQWLRYGAARHVSEDEQRHWWKTVGDAPLYSLPEHVSVVIEDDFLPEPGTAVDMGGTVR